MRGTLTRLLAVCEIFISVLLIFKIVKGIALPEDFVIFAAVTLMFCLTATRHQQSEKEERSRRIRERAKLDFDKERFIDMKARFAEEDGSEYETSPIVMHEYVKKIMDGEMELSDVPQTMSKAAREYKESGHE